MGVDVGEALLDELVDVLAGRLTGVADVEDSADLVEAKPRTSGVADEPDAVDVGWLVVPVARCRAGGVGGVLGGLRCLTFPPDGRSTVPATDQWSSLAMDVELLYFDGCPHWQTADVRLRQVAGEVGAAVRQRRVREGDDLSDFGGSPTILVDGHDPFPRNGPTAGALSCRLYATPDGPAGSPTVEQLHVALAGSGGREGGEDG